MANTPKDPKTRKEETEETEDIGEKGGQTQQEDVDFETEEDTGKDIPGS